MALTIVLLCTHYTTLEGNVSTFLTTILRYLVCFHPAIPSIVDPLMFTAV